jgi:hypothetical protein
MDIKKYLLALFVFTLIFKVGCAQNSLTVTDRNTTTFDMSAIIAAGNHTEMVVDNSQWINYSFTVSPSDPPGSISVSIASGVIPPGMEIYIQAGNENGLGHGKTGKPTGKIKLGNIPSVLINDIGTSYTGRGKHQGHQITLSIVIVDFALMQPGDYTLNLQYTLKQ